MLTFKTSLYGHQKKAVNKLSHFKVGALYMEMGTGKTRTALELCARRYNSGKVNHVLWLCPYSAKKSIHDELKKHIGGPIPMFTVCGIETLSSSIRANVDLRKMVERKNVYLVVDESLLVKNFKAIRTQNIIYLSEKCQYKLILNGTPISKCEADLFSQWYIIDWRILGYKSFWSFSANHLEYDRFIPGKVRRALNVDYLVQKISPFTYQIKKDECLDLPKKTYGIEHYDLDESLYNHYESTAEHFIYQLNEAKPSTIYRMFTALQNVISGLRVSDKGKHLTSNPFYERSMDNPRMACLFNIIERLNSKAIIYCKYTHEIRSALSEMKRCGLKAVPYYGESSQRERCRSLDQFKDEAQFLVANKACAGYSLNLQFCSYVIFYSNDWNYATRIQAEDRVHRIGQKSNVHIIDICARNTLDERILSCLNKKENLIDSFKKWMDRMKDNNDLRGWIDGKNDCQHHLEKVRSQDQ